jgi:hypothetical protein
MFKPLSGCAKLLKPIRIVQHVCKPPPHFNVTAPCPFETAPNRGMKDTTGGIVPAVTASKMRDRSAARTIPFAFPG